LQEYKENCGFREKVGVCNFMVEDCKPEQCDMYDIPFTSKGIKKQSRIERKKVIEFDKKIKAMKKNHEHKSKPEEYKKVKADLKDIVIGMVKLSKAYEYCKRVRL